MPLILLAGNAKYPTGLSIQGSSSVEDKSVDQYTCNLVYSNGSTKAISPTWSLTQNLANASIDSNGLLTTVDLSAATSTMIQADYTDPDSGLLFSNTLYVAVTNSYYIVSLDISGADLVTGLSTNTFNAVAHYSNGDTLVVAPTWSTDGVPGATINSSGALTLPAVAGNQTQNVNASYTEMGVTVTDTKVVNIGVVVSSITISGSTAIGDNTTSQYTATAYYSDDTSAVVVPTWTLGGTDNGASVDSNGLVSVPDLAVGAVRPLTASYTELGVTVSSTINLSITNVYDIQTLEILGPAQLADNTVTDYGLRATFTDSSTLSINDANISWSLSSNTVGASINGSGVLSIPDISAAGSVTISASYTYLGQTQTATWDVQVSNDYKIQSLTVNGQNSLTDNASTTYTCTATYPGAVTQSKTPIWTLSSNEARASIDSAGHLTVPYLDFDSRVTVEAKFVDTDQIVYASKTVAINKQKGAIDRILILGAAGSGAAITDGISGYGYNASQGQIVLPVADVNSVGYVGVWIDFDFGGFVAHVGTSSNGRTVLVETVPYSSEICVKTIFWAQNKAYRTHSISTTKPSGTAHLLLNFGDKKVWINGTLIGSMSLEYSAMADTATIGNGFWLGACPITLASSLPQAFRPSKITNLVFGSIDLNQTQVSDLYTATVSGDYSANGFAVVPSVTAYYKLQTDCTDYAGSANLTNEGIEFGNNTVFDASNTTLHCIAVYKDGSSKNVSASWTVDTNSLGITIDNGVLTVPEIDGSAGATVGTVTINASYTEGQLFVASLTANVVNDSYLEGLTIVGDASANSSSQHTYVAKAWIKGVSSIVSPAWSLTNNSIGASIDSNGLLTIPVVSGRQGVTVNASYTLGTITQTANLNIVIDDTYSLISITINGSNSVQELSETQYVAVATYSDNALATIVPVWSIVSPVGVHTISEIGILTVADLDGAASGSIELSAEYVENGVTKTASKTITVINSVVLESVIVQGPVIIKSSDETYTCLAILSNGQVVTTAPSWSVTGDNTLATFGITSGGVLSVSGITGSQTLTVSASVTYKGLTVNGSLEVLADNVAKTLISLDINGATTLPEQDDVVFTATASYTNGDTASVNCTWSLIGIVPTEVSLTGNVLSLGAVSEDKQVTIRADYAENGVIVSQQRLLTVANTVYPTAIEIIGPTEVSDYVEQQYTVNVTFADGRTLAVDPSLCSWNLTNNSIGATISGSGLLSVPNIVVQNSNVSLNVSYTNSGYSVNSSQSLLISNLVAVSNLEILGQDIIYDYDISQYTCRAYYPDNTYQTVVPTWSLHNNTIAATIDPDGTVHVPDIFADSTLQIVASFQDGSTIVTTVKDVTVIDDFYDILGLQVQIETQNNERGSEEIDALVQSFTETPDHRVLSLDAPVKRELAVEPITGEEQIAFESRETVYLDDNSTYDLALLASTSGGTRRVATPGWTIGTTDSRVTLDTVNNVLVLSDFGGTPDANVFSFVLTSTVSRNGQFFSSTTTCIVKNTFYLLGLSIDCDASMDDNTSQQLVCIAQRKNNVYEEVTPTWTLTGHTLTPAQGSFAATLGATGLLEIGDVGGVSGNVYVRADYTEGGISRYTTKTIKIANTHYPTSLEIGGPTTVNDFGTQAYTFTVTYSDSSVVQIDPASIRISFSSNTAGATHLGGGIIKIPNVTSQRTFTMIASYTENRVVTVTGTMTVTVENWYKITTLSILGPDILSDKSITSYALRVFFTDGYYKDLVPQSGIWSMVDGNNYLVGGQTVAVAGGSISMYGKFVAPNVPGTATKTFQNAFTYEGTTIVGTKTVTITDDYHPTHISIRGNTKLRDKRSYSFNAYAVYPDGLQYGLGTTPTWSLSSSIPGATLVNGLLTLPDLDQAYAVDIQASVTYDGSPITGSLAITIENYYGITKLEIVKESTNISLFRLSGQYVTSYADNYTHSFYARVQNTDAVWTTISPDWSVADYGYGVTHNIVNGRIFLTIPDLAPEQTVDVVASPATIITATYTEMGKTLSFAIPVYARNTYRIVSMVIDGPSQVADFTSTSYTCQVYHSAGGPTITVNPQLEIVYDTAGCSILGQNTLVVPDLPGGSRKSVRIRATYTESGVTVVALKSISIVESYGVSSLTISGTARVMSVSDKSLTQFACVANYPSGGSKAVTPVWGLSSNTVGATIDVYGNVRVPDSSAGGFTVTASYTEDNRVSTGSLPVTVTNSYYVQSLTINGTSIVNDKSKYNYSCTANYTDSTSKTVDPTWGVSGLAGVTISSTGELTIPDTAEGTLTVTASYTEAGVNVQATKTLTVTNAFRISVLSITGSNSINDKSTSQYSVAVTFTDGTTKVVVPTWSVASNTLSVSVNSSGLVTVGDANASGIVTLSASYTEVGVTLTATKDISINNLFQVSSIAIVGSASVNDHTSVQYSCTATYSDSSANTVVPTWSLTNNTVGASISSGGLMTIPDVGAVGSVTINASYSEAGTTKTTTLNVSVINAYAVQSLTLNGQSSIVASTATSASYTATATYTDSTTATVVPVWSISGDALGCSIDASGNLTVAAQTVTGSITLAGSYVENGVTVNAQLSVTLTSASANIPGAALRSSSSLLITANF